MVTELKVESKNLYDTDYNLWLLDTVQKLEKQEFNGVDWNNLIEEILDLSKRDKRKIESLLIKLIEHLLKLAYWQTEKDRCEAHWQGEIRTFRIQINRQLEDSPSLKNYLMSKLDQCYQKGKAIASDRSQLPLNTFPDKSIATLDEILDENWLP